MQVVLKNVRAAFTDALWEPKGIKGNVDSVPAYSCTFILEAGPDGAEHPQADEVRKAMSQAAVQKWPDPKLRQAVVAGIKAKDRMCLHDGNLKAGYAGFPGNLYISARSPMGAPAPQVVGRDRKPLTARDGKPYAGCYVNAIVEIYAQDNDYGKGINAALKGVQFVRDGDAFGAGAPISPDAFEALDDTGDSTGFDDLVGGSAVKQPVVNVEEDVLF